MKRGSIAAALLSMTLNLSGCSWFSGAGSMTIDVDVYKGPLSQHYHIQRGELLGLVKQFALAACVYADNVVAIALSMKNGAAEPRTLNCFEARNKTESIKFTCDSEAGLNAVRACKIAQQIVHEAFDIRKLAQDAIDQIETRADKVERGDYSIPPGDLATVGALTMRAKSRAIYWAEHLITSGNQPRATRTAIVTFANLLAEYGNQIAATTDALAKRNGMYDIIEPYLAENWCTGNREACKNLTKHEAAFRSGELLPPSVFLRESKPTAFINLYTWNHAGTIEPWENALQQPVDAFTPESTRDRVRATEQVFKDRYWSRINSVYASGRGDVNMAFVRSGEGNWGLKSFSSDPGPLLSAYRKIFTSTVSAITDSLAAGALPDPGILRQLDAMAGGAMVADAEDAVTPEQIDTLNALMLQKLLLFREQAQRLEEAQATDEAKAALLAEIRASLKVESDTLERMAGHFEDGREAAPAGSGP